MRYILFVLFMGFANAVPCQSAKDIVQKADSKMRGTTMQAEMVIKTIRPSWTREMQCKTWMKGNNLAMIYIQSPAKDKGIAFLSPTVPWYEYIKAKNAGLTKQR